jgi:mono/diheme cytochrome c family protein
MTRSALLALAAALSLAAAPALPQSSLSGQQLFEQECAACHWPYSPEFLPAESWTKITETLATHFGEDASLPADQTAAIRDYLVANASRRFGKVDAANPPLRISELAWFTNQHGRRLRAQAAADPKIGTMSNCAGCHRVGGYEND